VFYTLFVPDTVSGTGQQQLIGMKKMDSKYGLKESIAESVTLLQCLLTTVQLLGTEKYESVTTRCALYGVAKSLQVVAKNMEETADIPELMRQGKLKQVN